MSVDITIKNAFFFISRVLCSELPLGLRSLSFHAKMHHALIPRWRSPHTSLFSHSHPHPHPSKGLACIALWIAVALGIISCIIIAMSNRHTMATQWPSVRAPCESRNWTKGEGWPGWNLKPKPSKREQNNRAMRHICHSNAIARDNRFSFHSRIYIILKNERKN